MTCALQAPLAIAESASLNAECFVAEPCGEGDPRLHHDAGIDFAAPHGFEALLLGAVVDEFDLV